MNTFNPSTGVEHLLIKVVDELKNQTELLKKIEEKLGQFDELLQNIETSLLTGAGLVTMDEDLKIMPPATQKQIHEVDAFINKVNKTVQKKGKINGKRK